MSDASQNIGLQEMAGVLSNIETLHASREEDIKIRDLYAMFMRRRSLILAIIGFGLMASFFVPRLMTPVYKAKTVVLIEINNNQRQSRASTKLSDFEARTVETEVHVLRSRELAGNVIERLENRNFRETGNTAFRSLSVNSPDLKLLPPQTINPEIIEKVSAFLDRLQVKVLPGSHAVKIEYGASTPEKAALVANMVADTYINQLNNKTLENNQKLISWRDKKRTELQTQLRSKEQEIASYKAQNNLVEGSEMDMSDDQFSRLNLELGKAKVQAAQISARLKTLNAIKDGKASLEAAPDILNSEIIRNLKLKAVALQGDLSELSKRYGDKHPRMIEARAEINDLNGLIRLEMNKAAQAAQNDLNLAQAHIGSLERDLQNLKGQRFSEGDLMIDLRQREREAESIRAELEDLIQTYSYLDGEKQVRGSQARIISHAVIPSAPASPNKKLIFILGTLLSGFVALAAALFFEKINNTYRTASQLEKIFKHPCYGLIPQVKNLKPPHIAAYALRQAASDTAEAVRSLRKMLNVRAKEKAPQVITFTSSQPGEGKTTLSLWMARLAAKAGEKVIVLDMDLRCPNVHRSLGQKNTSSIVEYLTGQKSLKGIIQKDELSGTDIIYARSVKSNALDLISGARMQKLIENLRKEYDLVILDAPACLAFSDSQILAGYADHVLYAVSWNKTQHESLASGVKQFHDIDCKSLSFVLTNVDVKKHVRYGYGDTVYYGRYKNQVS